MHFTATVELGGKTATGLQVPDDVVAALSDSKKPRVTITVADHTYRTTVAVMGGRFMVPLSAENRAAAGASAGDVVQVRIELDDAPRVLEVPAELASALAAEPAAQQAFEALSYSNKRRYTLSVEGAKTDATRQRRIDKAVAELGGGT